ncbi:MAG: hypothetical protein LUD12_13185 [Lachnospiraceae bacterium]|nr:hypothetical protein [Lachnospiraceae bacterium]
MEMENCMEEMQKEMARRYCPQCGGEVFRNHLGRPRVFCSDACRYAWKHKHQQPRRWASTRIAVCPYCGKEFLASREMPNPRKYCSHACANRGRAKEKKESGAKQTGGKSGEKDIEEGGAGDDGSSVRCGGG